MKCTKCGDTATDAVTCGLCQSILHFGCAGVTEKTYSRMGPEKKQAWRCLQCRGGNVLTPTAAAGAAAEPTLLDVLREIKAFRSEFSSMQDSLNAVKCDVHNTSQAVIGITSKIESIENQISSLPAMQDELNLVQQDLLDTNKVITELKDDNNAREQFSRLNNIEISGVPVTKSENLNNILQNICIKVGFNLMNTDVDTIHRVRRFNVTTSKDKGTGDARPPAIIVRFTQRRRKDELLAAARVRKSLSTSDIGIGGEPAPLYLNDHLTPANKMLLRRAREAKSQFNYSYLWVRDCKIMMRKNDTSKFIHIAKESDLCKIK